MSEQNIVNVMVIPDVPKVLPGEQLYVYVPKASFTFPGIIAYNNTQFRIDGNFLFIREDYVSPGVQQKIDGLKQYTDDKLQLKQDKEDNNISLAQRPEQKSVVGAINDLGTLTQQAQDTADDAIRKIGDLSTLTTDEKTTIVGAINEVDAHSDTAQQTADNATNLANTGISKADQAQATADNATTLANTGISKAEQAQSTANTAVDKANDAKATANEAIMKADGRSNSIGFMTAKDAVTALNGYPRTQLKGGDTIWIVETGTPDLWVTEVAQESVPYNYTTKDKFNQDLVDNKVLQIGYFKTAYQESDGKPVTIAWQNVLVKSTDWVASTEFTDFPYEAKIELTDFVDYTTVPQVVFDIADTMSGNYAPICKSGDKCVYIYGKVQDEITLKTVITFAPNVNGASVTGGGYNNRGKWVASTTYEIDDLVYTDNGQFVCIEGITSTTSPEQDTTHWQATFVATGKTKNGLTISGQDNGTNVQKTFDGSQAVEVAFDETTMTAKEVNGVLKVGAKGTIPEALPQEASALKSGSLPTSGWTIDATPLWEGHHYSDSYEGSYQILPAGSINFDLAAKADKTKWFISIDGGYSSAQYVSVTNDNIILRTRQSSSLGYSIRSDGSLYSLASGNARYHFYGIKNAEYGKIIYTISDTSITTNSDILMELTDDGGVKVYAMEAGSITVIRDAVPTQPIPYTYKVKQTNASGQFTLVNHFVPNIPVTSVNGQTGAVTIAVPKKTSELTNDSGFITSADIPTPTYKKVSGELPTSGWSTLDEGWKGSTLPASRSWRSLTYGAGKYVAIAFNDIGGIYSTDGVTWTEMSMPANQQWSSIAYGNSKFVAIAWNSNKGAYSTDGITWTEMTLPASQKWQSVIYGNDKFVAVAFGGDKGAYSADGITWTEMTLPLSKNWSSVTYGNGKFVAVISYDAAGAYSIDGVTWTQTTLPASRDWVSVTYGDGKFVAFAYSTDKGAYSTDGITWTETTLPKSGGWRNATYGNGKFVVGAYNAQYGVYSTDGINWTTMSMPVSKDWRNIIYGNGKFVAVAADSSTGAYWKAAADITYTISDTDITANTAVKMYLTDAGGVKAQSKANGSITVIRDEVPTSAIPYEYEVEETSAEGLFEVINAYVPTVPTIPTKTSDLQNDSGFITAADIPTIPTKTSQLENDSNFAKTNTPNSWGSTQTFTAYDGIKTNRICNAAGTSLVDGTGTTNKFGNVNTPTIIKTSEARPKAEVPYADGTVTRQIALLEDIPSMVIDWVGPSATEQVITGTGMRQIFAEFTDTVGDVSTLYKFYGEVYVDGQNEVNGTSSTVYSTNTDGTELHVITVTPTIRRNTDNQFVLRAECCRYTIGASPMSINKSYLSFVFRRRLY